MGEAVVSDGGWMEATETVDEEMDKGGVAIGGCAGGGVGVKWERFFPRRALRVLLVEADDSTRQIIAALLRKCSYRVAAVPDGLKAWELLKGRPHNVDLILTEVDLPAISGFPLLTLIMEHEICKNIPVIMMSSNDTFSTVYKCMFRGAADYLVKPIRKNELKNLWQHVWRRQSSSSSGNGNGQLDETVALEKVEATAENNSASNTSGGYLGCVERNKELTEKGSDAQSCNTKPELGVDLAEVEQKPDSSQHGCEKDIKSPHGRDDMNFNSTSVSGHHDTTITSVREAINFIEAFDNQPITDCRSNDCLKGSYLSSQLDLSLRRSDSGSFTGQKPGERGALRHSDASAFSRYVNKPLHPLQSGLVSVYFQQKEHGGNQDTVQQSESPYESDVLDVVQPTSKISSAATLPRQSECFHSYSQQNVFPAPTPIRGMWIDNRSTEYGSVFRKACNEQSGASPTPSPSKLGSPESFLGDESIRSFNYENNHFDRMNDPVDQNRSSSSIWSRHKQEFNLDHLEDQRHVSACTDKSATSSFCNGTSTQLNSNECGSICASNDYINQVPVVGHTGENPDGFVPQDGILQRSSLREAALAKFRMKRKDRCYEKKVRYESRKKLAEKRPRLKGQFVRQVPVDPAPRDINQ